jgi:hypothetical protein
LGLVVACHPLRNRELLATFTTAAFHVADNWGGPVGQFSLNRPVLTEAIYQAATPVISIIIIIVGDFTWIMDEKQPSNVSQTLNRHEHVVDARDDLLIYFHSFGLF